MLQRVLRFSIYHPGFVLLLTVIGVVAGVFSLLRLPIDAVPDITNNQVQINTVAPSLSPFEVETALLEHDAVAECAVVAAPDEDRGNVVKAYVVLAEGAQGDVAALQDHVKQRIAPYKYPRRIEFLDALPRTPTGKVQRSALRRREA